MLSIVTLSSNCKTALKQTCDSVLSQKFSFTEKIPIEHIIIDNVSSDGSIEFLKSKQPAYKNQKIDLIVRSEPDSGISDGFNKGVKLARYENIHILNSGDLYQNNESLSSLIRFIQKNKFDISYGDISIGKKFIEADSFYKSKIKGFMPRLNHPSMIIKKHVYETIGEYSQEFKIAMDYEFLLRCHLQNIIFKNRHDHLIYMDPNGVSNSRKLDGYKEVFRISKFKFLTLIYIVYNFLRAN